MNLSPTEEQQDEMRHAHYDGALGILVSGLVWITAAVVCFELGINKAVWTLFIGGVLIHPIGTVVEKAVGRPAKTDKANALNQLAMASTIWLILCCAMAYGLFLLDPGLFFPAMMATIGSRYLVFATVYGRTVFWTFGGSLIAAHGERSLSPAAPMSSRTVRKCDEIMSSKSEERFVADGGSRWWESAEGEKVGREIEVEVRSRYRAELERAGWLKRLLLEYRVRREIAAERTKVLWARR